jgi:hypothetical protein
MSSLRSYLRTRLQQPMVRPLALVGPVVVLIITLPLLRPLRHPSEIADDELLRLATIRSLAERGTLEINPNLPESARSLLIVRNDRYFSPQPPMMSLLLAPPAWVMLRAGWSFDENALLMAYILTLLGTTLPVALSTALLYRMFRLFELRRPWRSGLSIGIVLGSGMISYATVLNPHAPAAALVLGSAAGLIHVSAVERAGRRWLWLILTGLASGLGTTLDPAAGVLTLLFMFVITAMRFPISWRIAGIVLFVLGASGPILLHAQWNRQITGNWLPAPMETVTDLQPRSPTPGLIEDEPDRSLVKRVLSPLRWIFTSLLGAHGLLSHFPVVIIGVAGVFAVMHRHWPTSTKVLAAASLTGAITIILMYAVMESDWRGAEFACRWFVVFTPMLLFWIGAWLRRSHKPAAWTMAAMLMGFSVLVGSIGATGPWPPHGFTGYSAWSAVKSMLHVSQE